jgi:hypothetical protein
VPEAYSFLRVSPGCTALADMVNHELGADACGIPNCWAGNEHDERETP